MRILEFSSGYYEHPRQPAGIERAELRANLKGSARKPRFAFGALNKPPAVLMRVV